MDTILRDWTRLVLLVRLNESRSKHSWKYLNTIPRNYLTFRARRNIGQNLA